ncbi:MAG: DUF1365 domain-containing protein [Hyphomicrobium sp.]|nr:DUF1365 domain-containing protein [Hyphomicrobium sp.]
MTFNAPLNPDDQAAIFAGHVVHKRLRPKRHALDYRVFTLLVDVDAIDAISRRSWLLSRNAFNLFSLYDRDHGAGDGQTVAEIARRCLADAGHPSEGRRILLLTYPRLLGYVFNPLSVFYVLAPDGTLETVIYEVSNTFGERKSYVLSAGERHDGGVYAQSCAKEMFVSPFADGAGGYAFRITEPANEAVVAVLLRDAQGALIKTHFRGRRRPMTDAALLRVAVSYPLMTLKIIAAIHYEALLLWLKGIPLTTRHTSPKYSSTPITSHEKG